MKRLFIGVLLLVAAVAPAGISQNLLASTVIEIFKYPSHVIEPIKIISVKYGDKEVKSGESFQAPPDWIKDLSVRVKNVSGQTLKYIEVGVNFPRDEHENPILPQISLSKGFNYLLSAQLPASEDFFIAPGEEVDLFISESEYKAFDEAIKNIHPPSSVVQTANVRSLVAAFSPNRLWARGAYLDRDPQNPMRWIVDQEEKNKMLRRMSQSFILQEKSAVVRKISFNLGQTHYKTCNM